MATSVKVETLQAANEVAVGRANFPVKRISADADRGSWLTAAWRRERIAWWNKGMKGSSPSMSASARQQ
jgi:hypothetical protein